MITSIFWVGESINILFCLEHTNVQHATAHTFTDIYIIHMCYINIITAGYTLDIIHARVVADCVQYNIQYIITTLRRRLERGSRECGREPAFSALIAPRRATMYI